MIYIKTFTFNPIAENTYVVYDDSAECVIIDPGCYFHDEKEELKHFIDSKGLKPVRLLNTHCHLDHVFGNKFVFDTYGLKPEIHEAEIPILADVPQRSIMFGIPSEKSPEPEKFINDSDLIQFGNTSFKAILTPGHSPGSISFYCEKEAVLFSGDVLFNGSIGRTDLPLANYDQLMQSIHEKIMNLPLETVFYPGHGPSGSLKVEKASNPFLINS